MSIKINAKLLDAAVKGLGITIPVRSARKLKGGGVEVGTRDGLQVWKPPVPPEVGPKVEAAPESVSKPRAARKRATSAKKEAKSETDD